MSFYAYKTLEPKISTISLDGKMQLAAGVAAQALRDLLDPDILKAADALIWWIDPGAGPAWLDWLGVDNSSDPNQVFLQICGVLRNAKAKNEIKRYVGNRN
jgi:hypothetical protein